MTLARRQRSIITVANEHVSIVTACRLAGADVPDGTDERSVKVRCPFGRLSHSDGGVEAALRIYTTSNTAWCFACHSFYTPVKILAQARDIDWHSAAAYLLDHVGYRPASLAEQWADVAHGEVRPDTAQLADALKMYCRRVIPGWSARQFDAAEAALLRRCLELLDRVRTAEDAETWLVATKAVMYREFAGTHPCHQE